MMTKIVVLVTGFDSGIPAPKFVAPKILEVKFYVDDILLSLCFLGKLFKRKYESHK
jgi:hypothetical protein